MSLVLTIIAALLVLGVLAYVVAQWPDPSPARRKKKEKPEPVAAAPAKDQAVMIEKLERRIRTLESSVQSAQDEVKDKMKEIAELQAAIGGFERQLAQEKSWREREESSAVKEKRLERGLRDELQQTREALDAQSGERIRLEHEVKELHFAKGIIAGDLRRMTAQHNDLARRMDALLEEARELRSENAKLRIKKEADAWVAKDDHDKVAAMLKDAERRIEELKQRLPAQSTKSAQSTQSA
jgi:chromosome segregation ATPase